MANIVKDSAYNVYKMLWLIGSGDYYHHNIIVGKNKNTFIDKIKYKVKI